MPKQVFTGGIDVNLHNGFYGHITINHTSALPLDDANSIYAKSYTLIGSRLGYKTSFNQKLPIDFFIGADNILDQTYSLGNDLNAAGGRYFNAAPRRNYYVGIQFDLNFSRPR